MATLSSVALLTIMFSIKSLTKSLTLDQLQGSAKQVLTNQNITHISDFLKNHIPQTNFASTTIIMNGIEFKYNQYPDTDRAINWPLPGYSIESNYASRLTQFKSQVTTNSIQTTNLLTALSCINVTARRLNKIPQDNYKLTVGDPDTDFIQYEFDNITGELWKSTATSSDLVIDLNFEADQKFSRADFAVISVSGKNISAVIFAVTHSKSNPTTAPNRFYILFDDIGSGHNSGKPIAVNDLIELNHNHEFTGTESGFYITLAAGKMDLSAITTINDQIVFITQSRQANNKPSSHIYKNSLYQINLTLTEKQIIQTRTLADSLQLFQLKTQLANQNTIAVGTEVTPLLITFPLRCRQIYQYEE